MKILIVEDSQRLRQSIAQALRRNSHVVDESGDGEDGLWHAREYPYDMIILDLMLPGIDGLEILARLRARQISTPVLLLTARNEVEDRVKGLQAGADDYLGKPFALEELLARVDALGRRGHHHPSPMILVDDLTIDTAAKRVSRGNQNIELTPREYRLLEALALEKGKLLTRTQLESHLYEEEDGPLSNVVDTVIYQLRRKLKASGKGTRLIETRRGHGYILTENSSEPE